MQHIVYVIEDITRVGGRESITLAKARQLASLGYRISIVSHCQSQPIFDETDVAFVDLKIDSKRLNKRSFCATLKQRLHNWLQGARPDIFICMIDRGLDVYKTLLTPAKKVIEIHGSHDFYFNFLGRKSGYFKKISKFLRALRLRKKLLNFDRAVILFEKDVTKWDLNNAVTIPNFFEATCKLQSSHYYPDKFISAGRLSHEKGYDLLLDIWSELKRRGINWQLDIYGDGEEKPQLIQKINELGLQHSVHILPFCSNLSSRYHEYCSYLLPSRCEAFPMVILESFAAGVPVIAFNSESGVGEMIENNINGMLIPIGNTQEFANAVIAMQSQQTRAEYSRHTIQSISRYQPEIIMKKWECLFEDLCR